MSETDYLRSQIRTVPDWPEPGVMFRDITPLLQQPRALRVLVDLFVHRYMTAGLDLVAGIDARGFIVGAIVAYELNLGFVPVRKRGKLPFETIEETYELEYGSASVELHADACRPGDRVLLIDDLIATGGTQAARAHRGGGRGRCGYRRSARARRFAAPRRGRPARALPGQLRGTLMSAEGSSASVRLDKWLWAARFFRSRSLAQTAIDNGRVLMGGQRVKLSRALRVGDELTIRVGDDERTVVVRGLDERRGPAPVAQTLYEETADSLARREARREARKVFVEPGESIEQGRPTKRDRRELERWRGQGE
jgi:adenine phosphoribosyltransferase